MTDAPISNELAEKSLLCAFLDGVDCGNALEISPPHEFYSDSHQRIAREIETQLKTNGKTVSVVSIATSLQNQGRLLQVGGTDYLSRLVQDTPASSPDDALNCADDSNLELFCRTLKNGTRVVFIQCMSCGNGEATKTEYVEDISRLPAWSYSLQKSIREAFRPEREAALITEREARSLARRRIYEEYLKSDAWRDKRRQVSMRAGGLYLVVREGQELGLFDRLDSLVL